MTQGKDINLIIVDRPDNYYTDKKKNFKPDIFFKTNTYVQDETELKAHLQGMDPQELVLIFVHADRTMPNFHVPLADKLLNIRKVVGKDIKLRLLTSDEAHVVKQQFQGEDVDRYNDILRKAESEYTPQTVAEALGLSPGNKGRESHIFVSHASANKVIVDQFVEKLLLLGLNIDAERIFYSSSYGMGVVAGKFIPDGLKDAMLKMTFFIQFVTPEYLTSPVCLNEMGAAWYKLPRENILLLIEPGMKVQEIGFINVNHSGIYLNDETGLYALYDTFKGALDTIKPKLGVFNTRLKEFMDFARKHYGQK